MILLLQEAEMLIPRHCPALQGEPAFPRLVFKAIAWRFLFKVPLKVPIDHLVSSPCSEGASLAGYSPDTHVLQNLRLVPGRATERELPAVVSLGLADVPFLQCQSSAMCPRDTWSRKGSRVAFVPDKDFLLPVVHVCPSVVP